MSKRIIAQPNEQEISTEKTKPINIFENDYNVMTRIAQLEGLIYPAGHTHAGKMNPAKTMQHIIKRLE